MIAQSTKVADFPDRHELRQRMFAALQELFTRLAHRRPVVLVIDDLQWTDDDSLELMKGDLGWHGDASAAARCHDATGDGPRTQERDRCSGGARAWFHYRVGAPPRRGCVRACWSAVAAEVASGIVNDCRGGAGPPTVPAGAGAPRSLQPGGARASLDDTLWSRIASLPDDSRRLLALMSVAGSPIVQEVAAHAAEMDYPDYLTTASLLRVAYLLRSEGMRRADRVSVYHDRIRELVSAHLDCEEKRHYHERLAITLESAGAALSNPYALVRHAKRQEPSGARPSTPKWLRSTQSRRWLSTVQWSASGRAFGSASTTTRRPSLYALVWPRRWRARAGGSKRPRPTSRPGLTRSHRCASSVGARLPAVAQERSTSIAVSPRSTICCDRSAFDARRRR